jgi:4-carboxymuconolactone decarboxylase
MRDRERGERDDEMSSVPREPASNHSLSHEERIPLPDLDSMTVEQRETAESLAQGPRKGVFGPYIPLLQSPRLLHLMEPLGAELRFHSHLHPRVRELVICAVARHTSNQFEWTAHVSLAVEAGVSRETLTAVREGRTPVGAAVDEYLAVEFAQRLMSAHGVSDSLFAEAKGEFGVEGIVELTTLIGYFVTVCWIMNVARTRSDGDSETGILRPYVD